MKNNIYQFRKKGQYKPTVSLESLKVHLGILDIKDCPRVPILDSMLKMFDGTPHNRTSNEEQEIAWHAFNGRFIPEADLTMAEFCQAWKISVPCSVGMPPLLGPNDNDGPRFA